MLAFDVQWPGIPGDAKAFTNQTYDQDLFSRLEYDEALEGDTFRRELKPARDLWLVAEQLEDRVVGRVDVIGIA